MKIKILILVLVMFGVFISGCTTKETSSNLLKYENKDLGIAFEYPTNFRVYQADKDTISVDSGYEDAQHPLVQISIAIRKFSTNKKSLEEIKSMTQPLAQATQSGVIYKVQSKDKYEIVIVDSSNAKVYFPYYILSEKGSFVVDHAAPIWKEQLPENLYSDYNTKFDAIIESIKII